MPLHSLNLNLVAMTGKFGIAASFAIIFVYAAELFPTVLRSAGMGMSSTAARVGGIAAPMVVLMSSVFQALPMLIFGVVAFLAGLLILTLPETLGKTAPETVADCENEQEGEVIEMKEIKKAPGEASSLVDEEAPSVHV